MGKVDDVLENAPPVYVRPVGLAMLGSNSHFAEPYRLSCPHRIHVGSDVWFARGSYLSLIEELSEGVACEPELRIGDRCAISMDLFVSCAGRIEIGSDVGIAPRVYIGDTVRDYSDPDHLPVEMAFLEPDPVRICDGAILGIGAVVLPGVTIGEQAVVAANAVVTRDVPARTLVFGNPARVVRSWGDKPVDGPGGDS